MFPSLLANPWIEFEDANGYGLAQPDIIIPGTGFVLVVECKLSDSASADAELRLLYGPLAKAIWRLEPVLIQAYKFCQRSDLPRLSPATVIGLKPWQVYTWQNL